MKWIKAIDRLPELPNPLPPNTEDERGVLFVNRTHSCAHLWFPSYGYDSKPHVTEDGHWNLSQWEWLDETTPVNNDAVETTPSIRSKEEILEDESLMLSIETGHHWYKHLMVSERKVLNMILKAMEEYAAQFHPKPISQPVEETNQSWVRNQLSPIISAFELMDNTFIPEGMKEDQALKAAESLNRISGRLAASLPSQTVDKEFLEFVTNARNQFCLHMDKHDWSTPMRTAAESLLIAYDQMKERLRGSVEDRRFTLDEMKDTWEDGFVTFSQSDKSKMDYFKDNFNITL